MSFRPNAANVGEGDAIMIGRSPARPAHGSGYGAYAYARQAAQQYKSTNVTTANPAALVVMMYDGAVRFVRQGEAAIEQGDFESAHNNLVRAQDIVSELNRALDLSQGEIAANLQRLYDFILSRLVQANVRKDTAPLREAERLLQELREAWEQMARGEGAARAGDGA